MKNKFSLTPKPATKLNLKKILIHTVVVSSLLSGVIYTGLTFFGVIGNSTEVFAANNLGYTWEAVISIDHAKVSGPTDLIDFPVLIKVTNTGLKSISNGGKVESINGFDIVFADMNDNLLDHQMESYNATSGEYIAWVRIPIISATANTDLKLFYGNSAIMTDQSTSNVWSGNYGGVWHMNESPAAIVPQLVDYSGNGNAGTANGGMGASNRVAGKIGYAIDFDGSNDYFDCGANSSTEATLDLTVSAWVNTDGGSGHIINRGGGWNDPGYSLFKLGNNIRIELQRQTEKNICDNQAPGHNEWYYVALTYSNSSHLVKCYINGIQQSTTTTYIGPIGTPHENLNIGRKEQNGYYFNGKIDEGRVIMEERSADWLLTEFNNQDAPDQFASIVFNSSALPVELIDFNAQLVGSSVEVTWSTATEINNDFFTIEKSTDAVNFEFVGEVTGAGNSNSLQEYTYIDDNLLEGVSYYRLKQTDFDGKFKYFSPKTINSKPSGEGLKIRSVMPNPFSIQFTLSIESKNAGIAEFTMFNINGTKVDVGQMHLNEGVTEYVYIDENGLLRGTYILNLVNGESLTSCKVVKR